MIGPGNAMKERGEKQSASVSKEVDNEEKGLKLKILPWPGKGVSVQAQIWS